jgi:hypothetical protein
MLSLVPAPSDLVDVRDDDSSDNISGFSDAVNYGTGSDNSSGLSSDNSGIGDSTHEER